MANPIQALRGLAAGLASIVLLAGGTPALAQAEIGGAQAIQVDVLSAASRASGSGARAITRVARVGDDDKEDVPGLQGPGGVCAGQGPNGSGVRVCAGSEGDSPLRTKR